MQEGWADFYSRCLLSSPDEDVNGIFPIGAYSTLLLLPGATNNYYYGVRLFPYAVITNIGPNGKPHNPMTFADIDHLQASVSDGAFPPNPGLSTTPLDIHNIGTVWCMMLLEMRARMVARLGWEIGNQRALQVVTDGMKLDPANPTFIQARDSIIAADLAGFGGEDVPDIRSAFALRGAGAGSSVVGTTTLTVTESYYPAEVPGPITFSDSLGNTNGAAEPGEDLVFTLFLTNALTVADTSVTAVLGNFTANFGTLPPGAAAFRKLNFRVPSATPCGSILPIPLRISSDNGDYSTNVPLLIGAVSNVVIAIQDFDSSIPPALPPGWSTFTSGVSNSAWLTVNSPLVDSLNNAFAADVAALSDASLLSPSLAVTTNNLQLSFKHRYDLERGFDGGVLEMAVDSGPFTDILSAGATFVQGGYDDVIITNFSNPLGGRTAWTGTQTDTLTTVVQLPDSLNGHRAQFRWRLGCDISVGIRGWNVDTVTLSLPILTCSSIDSDGDGIPDGYETAHGLDPQNPADALEDLDGDGQSNLNEYLAGTDPQNPNSLLRINFESRDPITGHVVVSFRTANGHVYAVEGAANLLGNWFLLRNNIIGAGGTFFLTDISAPNGPQARRFYRVRLLE
jgi:hypothetical protein